MMNALVKTMRTEPAIISGAILAAISLVTTFGLDLSNEQIGAIMALCSAIMALVVRLQVTPTINVSAEKDMKTGQDVAGEAVSPEIPVSTPVEVTPAEVAPTGPVAGEDYEGKHGEA